MSPLSGFAIVLPEAGGEALAGPAHAQSSGIAAAGNTPRLALVTCYPFDGLQRGKLRYVVFAKAVPNQ